MKQTKMLSYLLAAVLVLVSCQKDEITEQIDATENDLIVSDLQKNSSACETQDICFGQPIPAGWEHVAYIDSHDCPPPRPPRPGDDPGPRENARRVSRGLTPQIVQGGGDATAVWMIATKVGKDVGVTTRDPITWAPLQTYTKNSTNPKNKLFVSFTGGKWTCSLTLATQNEKNLFTSPKGLLYTIYNLNDGCGKWSTKLIKGKQKPPTDPCRGPQCP
ncbi:hypothetical protein [Aquimarina sp. AU58]|uniref:hypothetical protein n=1 Tax=Aquimarina sp. AU58 TaxID=1874112 RepID=UPI000D6DE557|nr:hypothetical protein [Aquimarina sp. AU58]